eukprot:TRINITY_DN2071_c0_g1_i1.p1 TRINITY_DN2071_c0_g1~~TRINITY_DN2071_c0_g1_i1.p1  ORF type:complete len:220 (-),score=64.87 TRINITY_DN2071_c0_g1_i1:145-738(-)
MWLNPDQMNSLLYWDNPRDSGIACGSVLVCLLAVRYISLISVIGNLSLALVTATMSFRIYKSVLAAVNKTQEGHPFKQFLDIDVTLPADKVAEITDALFNKLNSILAKLKSVLLVENVLESLKFAVAMYAMTYIGALMNGLTIVTLAWVGYFSLPRVYRDNQKQIDEAINPLKSKLADLQAKLQSALPASIVGKKEE